MDGSTNRANAPKKFARKDYPLVSQEAGNLSAWGQRWYMRLILVELGAAFVAAFASDASSLFPQGTQVLLALVTVAFLLITIASLFWRRRMRVDRMWFEGRAVRESTKTATWRYMMKIPPFDSANEDADAIFDRIMTRILGQAKFAKPKLAATGDVGKAITDRMRELRATDSWEDRRSIYNRWRLKDQFDYYHDNARKNARWASGLSWATGLAQAVAIAAALVRVANPNWNLVGVVTTLGASMVAWSQAKRFDELAASYQLAADELHTIAGEVEDTSSEQALAASVANAESAISREHTMWIARSGSSAIWEFAAEE